MRILALDLGTKTGWALLSGSETFSGVWTYKPGRFEGGGMIWLRFHRFLDELHDNDPIDLIVFEEVRRHLGVDAAHKYGGFLAHLAAFCDARSIPYQGVPVGTIKKHATGKGNADKAAMIDAARARGFNPKDDNEADALALLDYARQEYGKAVLAA